MVRSDWKTMKVSEILGVPNLDTGYLPPHVLVELRERISGVEGVGGVVLYGSIIRGEASPKSDIDVMIFPIKQEDLGDMKSVLAGIFRELEKKYSLRVSFSQSIYTGKEDTYFLWELARDGVVIYCRPEMLVQPAGNARPCALLSYSYSGLDARTKQMMHRMLFDSKSGLKIDRGNKMEYIAPGVILLPVEKEKMALDFFERYGVKYGLTKIWL